MEFNYFQLKNGIRIIHKPTKSNVAHCGFTINTGSRDEKKTESGITHFIEHAIFKILNRIDSVGGEINAYTTKESTSIYASFTTEYFDRATELLSDILFNSTYPEKELEKEKDVIIDEIFSYQDNPFEQIYDDFEEMIYNKHPLGMNILGTVKSVEKINRDKILDFIKKHYNTDQIVFSIVGNISLNKVRKITEKYLNDIPSKSSDIKRKAFTTYQSISKTREKEISQTHCMIGNMTYGAYDKNRNGFTLLNNILGGPAMNSRLNMGIREKYGYTYNIESSYTIYSDNGLFNIYLGTDKKNIDKSIKLVHKELRKLKNIKLSENQLTQSKRQLIGQITLSEENNCNVMLGMGKSLLTYNKVDDLTETYFKINKITRDDLQNIANEIFDENKLSTLIYSPIN